MLSIERVRADTPSCENLLHFNSAGASIMPTPVYDAVLQHLALEQEIGGYEAHAANANAINDFYAQFATLLNANTHEIAFIENATRAWDMAFYAMPLEPGDRILTHDSEYISNYLALLQQAQRRSLHVDLVPSDEHGQIDLTELQNLITDRTKLIALTHVPTQGGLVNPAKAVGQIAKDAGLIYLLDACQSVGQMPLDVKTLQCDVLSGTGRKFLRGPRGTGFLYVREGFLDQLDPPFVDLHSASWTRDDGFDFQPNAIKFENWESFYAGRVGLAKAAEYANEIGLEAIEERVIYLADRLRGSLQALPGVSVHDLGRKLCGIVTFSKNGLAAKDVATTLREQRMNVSVSLKSSARLDFNKRGLDDILRASVHYFNTDEEVDRFLAAVDAL